MAATASAQWMLVDEGKNGDKFYADPTTKKRAGNVVRIWEMQDYLKPEIAVGKLSYSTVVYREYDCASKMVQTLQGTEFSGQMATGESLVTHTRSANKSFVPPRTVAYTMLNYACN